MRDLAAWIADRLIDAARTSLLQWVLRLGMVIAAGGGLWLCSVWGPLWVAPLLWLIGGLSLGWAVVQPDSLAPAVVIGVVVIWWLLGAAHAPLWQAGVLALTLGVVHLCAAWSSLAPAHAQAGDRLVGRLLPRGAIYLVAVAASCLLAAQLAASSLPRGWGWWLVAAGLLVATASRLRSRRQ